MKLSIFSSLVAGALLASSAASQNLLTNPGFESGFAGWTAFANANPATTMPPAIVPRTGNGLATLFGPFSGGFDVSGIFQAFPANPGDSYTMDCWSRHFSGDALTGNGPPNDNWMVMKIAFFDAGGVEIAGFDQIILDGTSPTDTWIDNTPVSGTAPAGTVQVQALVLFLQPNGAGGAGQVDDVEFTGPPPAGASYPGSGDDFALATGINGAAATGGPGDDIKSANGGELVECNLSSPNGAFDRLPYFLVGQAFGTGAPPMPSIFFPDLFLNISQPILVLVDGSAITPLGPPVLNPGSGSSSYFVAPSGMGGMSVMLHGFLLSSSAANGVYATTDGHEIRLN